MGSADGPELQNWGNESISFCEWEGIDCDESGNINVLYLENHNITGSLPAAIGDLTELQVLILNDNNFSGPIPSEIGRLKNLQYLGLFNNDFTGTVSSELCDITDNYGGFLQSLLVDCDKVECSCCTLC